MIVHYTGMYAFAETDSDRFGTTSDEPYVALGVVTPSVTIPAVRSQVYDDVDKGDSRPRPRRASAGDSPRGSRSGYC